MEMFNYTGFLEIPPLKRDEHGQFVFIFRRLPFLNVFPIHIDYTKNKTDTII